MISEDVLAKDIMVNKIKMIPALEAFSLRRLQTIWGSVAVLGVWRTKRNMANNQSIKIKISNISVLVGFVGPYYFMGPIISSLSQIHTCVKVSFILLIQSKQKIPKDWMQEQILELSWLLLRQILERFAEL